MKKIVVGFLIASMLFAMTACGNGSTQGVDVGAEETRIEDNETLTDSEQNTETANVQTTEGMYTYTIYEGTENEMTLSMDVNIDDYISDGFFSVGYLARDLGWLKNGDPNFNSSSDVLSYYSYDNGDGTQTVLRGAYNYTDEDTPMGYPQINSYNVRVAPIDNWLGVYNSDSSEERYLGINVTTNQHYDDLTLTTTNDNELVAASRDDVVVLAYVFWSTTVNPGENCFYNSSLNRFRVIANSGNVDYSLP